MTDVFSKLNGGEILGLCGIVLGLVAVVGGIVVAIVKVVEEHYRKTQLNEMEATLKIEMIQRGMSAEEIKTVLESKMGSSKPMSLHERLGAWSPFFVPGVSGGKEAKKS
jgi:hypothetical protein